VRGQTLLKGLGTVLTAFGQCLFLGQKSNSENNPRKQYDNAAIIGSAYKRIVAISRESD
jgi:hypothetical protein